MTILVKNPRLTFIHIPKTAGMSISRWLQNHVSGSYLLDSQHGGKHADQKRIAKFMKIKEMDMGYTFCVVRNPWDRLVSAYHYHKRRQDEKLHDVSFEQFVYGEWNNQKNMRWGCAEKQMCDYFYSVDSILRFENLESDFKIIQNIFQKDIPLIKHNTSEHKDFRFYYTPEMVDIVAHKHAKDIATFNYSFE